MHRRPSNTLALCKAIIVFIECKTPNDWVIGIGYAEGIQMVTPSLNSIRDCEPFWKNGTNLKSQHLF
jgi:hypothetical protein